MPKRPRSGNGGGKGWDKHPQYLHFSAAQSGADATTTTTLALPREAFSHPNQPTILEILGVYFEHSANTTEANSYVRAMISTRSLGTTAALGPDNAAVIAWFLKKVDDFGTATTVVESMYPFFYPTSVDGYGILVATDNLYIQIDSAATTATNTVRGKILYRFVRVGLSEYVGILQSQQ